MLEAPGDSLTDVRDFLGHSDVSQTNQYWRQRSSGSGRRSKNGTPARTNLAQTENEAEHPQGVSAVTH